MVIGFYVLSSGATEQLVFKYYFLTLTLTHRWCEFLKWRRCSYLAGVTAFRWVDKNEGDLETSPV